jgi:hypothetical protein
MCYIRTLYNAIYGRTEPHTVLLRLDFEVDGYGLWCPRHHTSAVLLRPYAVYGTVYSSNSLFT